ncbi:MAG: aldehyde dehydrogenase family protein, partial [Anaerotignum sp.]|nr:aldehyde dehydrogenase family protein [Anaerotignum sp.]
MKRGGKMEIARIVEKQRGFFRTGKTIPLSYRKIALKKLARAIKDHEEDIYAALKADLNKSETEAYMCEIGMTLAELSYMLKHMNGWAQKQYRLSPLAQFSATSFTIREPYGVVLVMSPWNYPFLLTMSPLIGAIAAGNCCVVKPSAYAPATSRVIG